MRLSKNRSSRDSLFVYWLCGLGILLAAAAPVIAANLFVRTSPGDELGGVLLMVAIVAIAFDRK